MDSRDEKIADLESRIALNARLHGEENDKLRARVRGLEALVEREREDVRQLRKRLDDIVRLPEAAEIESALVDALEIELADYQSAPATWAAVTRVIDALRARDARIREMRMAQDSW
jgi:acetolactate synthase small subunit